jgi:hypothetical protein
MGISLNVYAAQKKRALFDDLRAGNPPSEGTFDEAIYKEAKAKGAPTMGATKYAPDALTFEFITQDPQAAAIVLSVRVEAPERIVFMPVPDWVVQTIWQGEIDGSYRFESEARAMLEQFSGLLEVGKNAELFGAKMALGKD